MPTVDAPLYFIAVASDAKFGDDLNCAFIDPHDDLLEQNRDELHCMRAGDRPLAAATAMAALGAALDRARRSFALTRW